MENFTINEDTKISLYFKGCYGCDGSKYGELHQFILDRGIPLANFVPKRIELNPDWQKFVEKLGIPLPLIEFKNANGEGVVVNYQEFVRMTQATEKESAKPQDDQVAVGAESEESPTAPSKKRKKAKNGNKANHK